MSRRILAAKIRLLAPTIRRFEDAGHISMKNFLRLWLILDDMSRIMAPTKPPPFEPKKTMAEVLAYNDLW
ncbi:Uncharacterised protein [Moraxella caviae]|uniref:Uncharacterized protein n=1 Tax=Moraxella caviae TaxID=34060 RepID=A0A378R8H3_9GAMM|nr:hypothetical protein [Moraxella caviae]STZ13698.1 Uncharacterised protein [Moraxella caviae]